MRRVGRKALTQSVSQCVLTGAEKCQRWTPYIADVTDKLTNGFRSGSTRTAFWCRIGSFSSSGAPETVNDCKISVIMPSLSCVRQTCSLSKKSQQTTSLRTAFDIRSIHRVKWRHNNLWPRYDLHVVRHDVVPCELTGEFFSRHLNRIELVDLRRAYCERETDDLTVSAAISLPYNRPTLCCGR